MSKPKHARVNDAHAGDDHAAGNVTIELYTDDDFPEDNYWGIYRPHPYSHTRPPWEEIDHVQEIPNKVPAHSA